MTLSAVSAFVVVLTALVVPTGASLPRSSDGGPLHLSLNAPRGFVANPHEHGAHQRDMRRDSFLTATGQQNKRQDMPSFNSNLMSWYDSAYSAYFSFGTPPQDFRLFLDTQIATSWVYDSSCTADKCKGHVGGFDKSKSSTYTTNDTYNNQPGGPPGIQAAGTWCNGTWGRDIVGVTNGLSGADRKNESWPNFAFMQCKVGGYLSNYTGAAPGILGMASPNLNRTTLFSKLATGWKDQRFGIHFAKQVAPANGLLNAEDANGGTLTLGEVNSDLFTGEINYLPVSNKWINIYNGTHFYWDFSIDVVEYGGKQYRSTDGNGTTGLIATFATQSVVPLELFNDIYLKLPGVQLVNTSNAPAYYAFPCNVSSQIGPLDFTMGGKKYSIPPSALYTPYEAILSSTQPSGWCMGLLTATGRAQDNWDYGFAVNLLRELYIAFQYSPPAVGFAQLSASAAANHTATGSTPAPSSTKPSGSSSMVVSLGVVALGLAVATLATT